MAMAISVILAMLAGLIVSFVAIQVVIGGIVFLWDNAASILFWTMAVVAVFIFEISGKMN